MKTRAKDKAFIEARTRVDENGCWIWTGAVSAGGRAVYSGKYAYRIAYEALVGPIPPGLQINHSY